MKYLLLIIIGFISLYILCPIMPNFISAPLVMLNSIFLLIFMDNYKSSKS